MTPPVIADRRAELEDGGVVVLADRPFVLTAEEAVLLETESPAGGAKNISFDPADGALTGCEGLDSARLSRLGRRYGDWAATLVAETIPAYAPFLKRGRTSFRPRAIDAEPLSPRKDDRRLHADAFPSRPTAGRRILRVFSNIDPAGAARVWRVGEPFEAYARRWIRRVRRPWPLESRLLYRLGVTRAPRTAYDSLMLGLHDRAKLDEAYQASAPAREIAFAAGTSWMVFTDQVVHAAISGRFVLEQTLHLPIEAMADPAASPLKVLERLTGRSLV